VNRLKRVSVVVVLFFSVFPLFLSARLFRLRTGNALGEGDVQLRTDYVRSAYNEMWVNRFSLDISYGIADGVDFTFAAPLYSLGQVDSSLVLGDLLFDLQICIKEWVNPRRPVLSSLFVYIGFQVGIGLSQEEGKLNPETGMTQTYYPFVNGLSEIYLGAGYTTPLGPMSLHLNFEYFNETKDNESITDFELGNDHISLRGGLSWYFEANLSIFGEKLNLGFKPFWANSVLLVWSKEAGMPSRLDSVLGVWVRFGSVFRVHTGFNLPLRLGSEKFLDNEFFISLAAVFR